MKVTELQLRNCPTVQPLPPELPVLDPRVAVGSVPSMRTLIGWDLGEGREIEVLQCIIRGSQNRDSDHKIARFYDLAPHLRSRSHSRARRARIVQDCRAKSWNQWDRRFLPSGRSSISLRDEKTADVEGDKGPKDASAGADDEGGGGGGEEGLDLVVVKLDDGGVDANGGEKILHDVARAAGGAVEDDEGVLCDEVLDSGLRGFV